MSELEQLTKLQKTIRELKELKIVLPTREPPKNRLSQNQIFGAGQMNAFMRMNEIIEKFK